MGALSQAVAREKQGNALSSIPQRQMTARQVEDSHVAESRKDLNEILYDVARKKRVFDEAVAKSIGQRRALTWGGVAASALTVLAVYVAGFIGVDAGFVLLGAAFAGILAAACFSYAAIVDHDEDVAVLAADASALAYIGVLLKDLIKDDRHVTGEGNATMRSLTQKFEAISKRHSAIDPVKVGTGRRHERVAVNRMVKLDTGNGMNNMANVIDISRSGVALRATVPLTKGMTVKLGEKTRATVVRVLNDRIALEFARVLGPGEFYPNVPL